MSAQEFVPGMSEMFKLNAERGATVGVRSGNGWLTRHKEPKDHNLNTGDALPLGGGATTVIAARQPTLLELYRQDPVAVREMIERQTRRARSEAIRAFFARFFG